MTDSTRSPPVDAMISYHWLEHDDAWRSVVFDCLAMLQVGISRAAMRLRIASAGAVCVPVRCPRSAAFARRHDRVAVMATAARAARRHRW